jgi:thiazolylpeptide-type bacteriocin precursor
MTPQTTQMIDRDSEITDPFEDLVATQLGELEIADAVALPEMGASSGSFACCSSSSSSCCS